MTLFQLEASAQAPCSSTITGLAECPPLDAAALAEAPAGVARQGAIASRAAARTTARSAGRLMRRAVRLNDMSVSSPVAEMRNLLVVRAFCLPVPPLSRPPAGIASVGIPSGSPGDTGAATGAVLRDRVSAAVGLSSGKPGQARHVQALACGSTGHGDRGFG